MPPPLEAQSLNHWTAREVPTQALNDWPHVVWSPWTPPASGGSYAHSGCSPRPSLPIPATRPSYPTTVTSHQSPCAPVQPGLSTLPAASLTGQPAFRLSPHSSEKGTHMLVASCLLQAEHALSGRTVCSPLRLAQRTAHHPGSASIVCLYSASWAYGSVSIEPGLPLRNLSPCSGF